MRYALLVRYAEMDASTLDEAAIAAGMRAFDQYAKALEAAGVFESAEVLHPSRMTTTVRVRDGQMLVQDGPFADTKEQLGGTFIVEVSGPEEAIEWAAKAPAAAWGAVEVRPVATRFIDGAWTGVAPTE